MTNNKNVFKFALYGAGVYVGWRYLVMPMLEALNLKATAEELAEVENIRKGGGNTNAPLEKNPWNKNFVSSLIQSAPKGSRVLLFNVATLNSIAKIIYDSKGVFNDNEEKLYGAIRQIKSHSQLSQLSGQFYKNYSRDLYNYIVSFTNTSELAIVTGMVNTMKKGILINNKLT